MSLIKPIVTAIFAPFINASLGLCGGGGLRPFFGLRAITIALDGCGRW
jgi:hypothetical protein